MTRWCLSTKKFEIIENKLKPKYDFCEVSVEKKREPNLLGAGKLKRCLVLVDVQGSVCDI